MDDKRPDWELLRKFVDSQSEAAFAQLTRRYLGLVLGTALRELQDQTLAEDVTQAVFLILSRKAHTFRPNIVLAAWLFDTCKFAAGHARRDEGRRQIRERKIAMELQQEAEDQKHGAEIRDAMLNEALSALPKTDRQAVLLRFVCGYSFQEAGEAFGISEDAARMRTGRALEKMRRSLTKAGAATMTALAVTELLQTQAAQAASAGLEAKIIGLASTHAAATVGGASAHTIAQGVLKSMSIMNIKIVAAVTCGVILAGGTAYQGVAGAMRPAAGGTAAYKGAVPITPPAATPNANLSVVSATGPRQVQVDIYDIDVKREVFDVRSNQVAPGDNHDAILMDALIKGGAQSVVSPSVTCTDNMAATLNKSQQIPYTTQTVVAGKTSAESTVVTQQNFLTVSTTTNITPHIDPNGTISVEFRLMSGGRTTGGTPSKVFNPVTAVFHDGQTLIVKGLGPENANDPILHLTFAKVSLLSASAAASNISGVTLNAKVSRLPASAAPSMTSTGAPDPRQVAVEVHQVDVTRDIYDIASKQIAAGDNYDAQLLDALTKGGAKNVPLPIITTTGNTLATVDTSQHVPYTTQTVVAGPGNAGSHLVTQQSLLTIPNTFSVTPRINANTTITVHLQISRSEPSSRGNPPAISTSRTDALKTVPDGQTRIIGGAAQGGQNGPVLHLIFVKATIIPMQVAK